MKHCKWFIVALVVLGFADFAPCEVGETVVLKAQLKLLQGKLDRQAGELKALQERVEQLKQTNARLKDLCDKAGIDTKVPEDRNPVTKPAGSSATGSEKPTVKSIPVSIRRVLLYAFQRAEIAKKEKMEVGRVKVLDDALLKIKSMLAMGPITLTYQVLNVNTVEGGAMRLSVGHPQEVLDACVGAKKFTRDDLKRLATVNAGTFSIILSAKQALAIRKGARFVLNGKARLYDRSKDPEGMLAVILRSPYRVGLPSFVNWNLLVMENFTILLNGKEVKSAE